MHDIISPFVLVFKTGTGFKTPVVNYIFASLNNLVIISLSVHEVLCTQGLSESVL